MSSSFRREIQRRGGSPVVVSIDNPIRRDDGKDYSCRYTIEGLSEKIERSINGIDEIQALLLAIQLINVDLEQSVEYKNGELSWLGSSQLGFSL